MSRELTTTRRGQGGGLAPRGWYHPFDVFRREMDSLFDHFFGGRMTPFDEGFGRTRDWAGGLDVEENDKEIVVRADVPGFEEDELDISLENSLLTIKAEKEQNGDSRREYRSFFRQMTLPAGVDADKIQASHRHGVLELHIPRPEGSQPKKIAVKGQSALAGPSGQGAEDGNGAEKGARAGEPAAKK